MMRKNFIIERDMPFEYEHIYSVEGDPVDLSNWQAQFVCKNHSGGIIFTYSHRDYALTLSDNGLVRIEISEDDTHNFTDEKGHYEVWLVDPQEEKILWMNGSVFFI